jgi:hypothetical protein
VAKSLLTERSLTLNEYLAQGHGEIEADFEKRVYSFYTNVVYGHLSSTAEAEVPATPASSLPKSSEGEAPVLQHRNSFQSVLSPVSPAPSPELSPADFVSGRKRMSTSQHRPSDDSKGNKSPLSKSSKADIPPGTTLVTSAEAKGTQPSDEENLSPIVEVSTPTSVTSAKGPSLHVQVPTPTDTSKNDTSTSATPSTDWSSFPRNILVMTHGGPIQCLINHLVMDMKFDINCDYNSGYPKNGALYKVVLR